MPSYQRHLCTSGKSIVRGIDGMAKGQVMLSSQRTCTHVAESSCSVSSSLLAITAS